MKKKTLEEFIQEANNIHDYKYDYSESYYVDSNTKLNIICKKHGIFQQLPSNHLNKQGCPICAKFNIDDFVERSIKIHDNKYDYSLVNITKGAQKATIICPIHGRFNQTADSHLQGTGCKKCRDDNNKVNIKLSIEQCSTKFNNYFDYSLVRYVNTHTAVDIICPQHGVFQQTISDHLQSQYGCKQCRYNDLSLSNRSSIQEFITKAVSVHGNNYNYHLVNYINAHTKVQIECKQHGVFEQTPNVHLLGSGCSACNNRSVSKMSSLWLESIITQYNINIQYVNNVGEYRIPRTRYKADGYCQETNTIYEFHGDYWHGNPKLYKPEDINLITKCTMGELYQKTLTKEDRIRELGYNLVTIWESDWNKIKLTQQGDNNVK